MGCRPRGFSIQLPSSSRSLSRWWEKCVRNRKTTFLRQCARNGFLTVYPPGRRPPSGSGLTHHFSQRFQGSEPVQSTSTRFSTPPGGGDGGCSFLYFFSRPEQEPTPLSPPGKVLRTN